MPGQMNGVYICAAKYSIGLSRAKGNVTVRGHRANPTPNKTMTYQVAGCVVTKDAAVTTSVIARRRAISKGALSSLRQAVRPPGRWAAGPPNCRVTGPSSCRVVVEQLNSVFGHQGGVSVVKVMLV